MKLSFVLTPALMQRVGPDLTLTEHVERHCILVALRAQPPGSCSRVIRGAARAAGMAADTLRRRLNDSRFFGATQ